MGLENTTQGNPPFGLLTVWNGNCFITLDAINQVITMQMVTASPGSGGAPVPDTTYPQVIIAMSDITALGLSNKVWKAQIMHGTDPNAACNPIRWGYIGTAPENDP